MMLRGATRELDIDLGPGNGSVRSRGPVSGTIAIPPSRIRERFMNPAPPRKDYHKRPKMPPRVECRQPMRLTMLPCARNIGHSDHCKSRYALDNEAAYQRARAAARKPR